jgi:hypothetical protein
MCKSRNELGMQAVGLVQKLSQAKDVEQIVKIQTECRLRAGHTVGNYSSE